MIQTLPPALAALCDDSRQGRTLLESRHLSTGLGAEDAAVARTRIEAEPGHVWYHALFALRRNHAALYAAIPPAQRAQVLCEALTHRTFYNDWGQLDPSGTHDGEAAKALLELDGAAAACLRPLLADPTPAPLYGSEDATMSVMYKYRRCDFAYRYLVKLRGGEPVFAADPAERDRLIEVERTATPRP